MKGIILFVITFMFVFLVYYIFVIKRKKSLLKWQNGKEMMYLKKIYKINIKEKKVKSMAIVIAITNSFIVAFTLSIISLFKGFVIQMILGFIILCGMILLFYHILGKYYQKKGRI